MNAKQAKTIRQNSDEFFYAHIAPAAAAAYVRSRNKWYLRLLECILPGLRHRLDARAFNAMNDRLYRAIRHHERHAAKSLHRDGYEKALSPKASTRETRARMPRTDKKEPRT